MEIENKFITNGYPVTHDLMLDIRSTQEGAPITHDPLWEDLKFIDRSWTKSELTVFVQDYMTNTGPEGVDILLTDPMLNEIVNSIWLSQSWNELPKYFSDICEAAGTDQSKHWYLYHEVQEKVYEFYMNNYEDNSQGFNAAPLHMENDTIFPQRENNELTESSGPLYDILTDTRIIWDSKLWNILDWSNNQYEGLADVRDQAEPKSPKRRKTKRKTKKNGRSK